MIRDRHIAALLFVAATAIGSAYEWTFDRAGVRTPPNLSTLPSRSMWYGQSDFGAAVALACGRGYADPGDNLTPGLTRFLSLQSDTFSCAELPATLPPRPLRLTARLYPYLLSTVGAVWAVRGVSWPALWPLFGFLYGVTVAVCYGLFRLGMGRVAATVVSVALMLSPVHLGNLPGLRDYAKAPFILGLILVAALLVRSVGDRRRLFALSALFGLVLGVGFGFRNDLLILVPLILVALLAWDPPRDRQSAGTRAAAIAIAGVTFLVVASPILAGYTRGSNSGHVALLGFMTPFDEPLGVTPSVYDWGHVYSDGYIDTLVKSYGERTHHRTLEYLSQEYDRTAVEYLVRIARTWPADIVTRAYASVLRMADMPFTPGTHAHAVPDGLTSPAVTTFYGWYNAAVSVMKGKGVVAVALALLVISGTSVWWAVLLLVDLLYLTGYPAIQFQPRHFFHLEFIAWWALGFLAARALAGFGASDPRAAVRRMATFALVAFVIVALPFGVARAYQEQHVRTLITGYLDARREPLQTEAVTSADRTLLRTTMLWDGREGEKGVGTEYVAVRFSPAACPVVRLPVTFRYAVVEGQDFSFDTVVTFMPPAPVEILFPAYDDPGKSRFDGVEVSRGYDRCVEQVARVRDLSTMPILVNLRAAQGWESRPMHQRLAALETSTRATDPRLVALPAELTLPVRTLYSKPDAPPSLWKSPLVHEHAAGWRITGTPPSPVWPLAEFAATPRTPDDQFVVEGEVLRGGITIGIVRDHSWTSQGNLSITRPGPFVAVFSPPAAGDYGVLWENGLFDSWFLSYAPNAVARVAGRFHDFNDVRITRAGWIRRESE